MELDTKKVFGICMASACLSLFFYSLDQNQQKKASRAALIQAAQEQPLLNVEADTLRDSLSEAPSLTQSLRTSQSLKSPARKKARRTRRLAKAGEELGLQSVSRKRHRFAKKGFQVQGRIYDIKTLKPVRGAKVYFENPHTGKYRKAVTDKRGNYRLTLKSNMDGYYVAIRRPGYSKKYMEDWQPSFKKVRPSLRRQVAREHLRKTHEKIHILSTGTPVERNFVLIKS